jgi:uncharacterized Zn finger protein
MCPKCNSDKTKVIGQSQKPLLTYTQCEGCGHVWVPQPQDKRS